MKDTLCIIDDYIPHTAAFNMAADQYLTRICPDNHTVYVRFYRWEKPTVTLGYMQKAEDVLDKDQCHKNGVVWVRRPTGGRAVLHHGDITYSCVFSSDSFRMGKNVAETFAVISRCLMNGLSRCGISCTVHDTPLTGISIRREIKLPCFLAPNRDEIMVDGKKLVGSAQKRTARAVLQHGSIPVTPAFRSITAYQKMGDDQKKIYQRLLKQKCTCVHELIPDYELNKLTGNLIKGFIDTSDFKVEEKRWTEKEQKSIEALALSVSFKNRWMQ